MRDLLRSWFWACGTAVVFYSLAGRSLAVSGTTNGLALVPLVLVLGALPALAAGVAHPAPARRSLHRYAVAVVPLVVLPALADLASAASAGATAGVVVSALLLTTLGGVVGAVLGAVVVRPRPARHAQWRTLRVARRRRQLSYLRDGAPP